LSFDALLGLAVACGIPTVLAWLLPVCVDAAAAVASRMWLSGRSGVRVYRYARRLALAALALSVSGNAAQHGMAAYGITPVWWVVVLVSAIAGHARRGRAPGRARRRRRTRQRCAGPG
jgi:thiosulfate reductase cytochrome b subunit